MQPRKLTFKHQQLQMVFHFLSKGLTLFSPVVDELLPIYFFIPSTCQAHEVTNFIDLILKAFPGTLYLNYSSLYVYWNWKRY